MARVFKVLLLLNMACLCIPTRGQDRLAQIGLDIIVFTNGDVLRGTVAGATSASVAFSNHALGQLTVSWADLRQITLAHRAIVSSAGSTGKPASFDAPTFAVSHSGAEVILTLVITDTTPRPVITGLASLTIPEPSPKPTPPPASSAPVSTTPHWLVSKFAVNTALLEATQKQQTYGAELDLLRSWNAQADGWPHQRTLIELIPNYNDTRKNAKIGSATVTQEYEATAQQLLFLSSSNFYGTLLADEYRNNSLGLYFQQSYGGGVGTIFHNVELNADLRFIGQHYYAPYHSTSLVGSELSERYDIPLSFLRAGAHITEQAIVIPVFNASKSWQMKGVVGLTIPLTKTISFTTNAGDYYVENTPDAYHKNYFKDSAGIQYTPAPPK
jgi:Protein of unknown function, DUF481